MGCGPAGLIAAHTLCDNGLEPNEIHIFSKDPAPSKIGGAQYLHSPIFPGDPDGWIETLRLGEPEGYAVKVYEDINMETSWGSAQRCVPAYSLRDTYARLWSEWKDRIVPLEVQPNQIPDFAVAYDKTFSSVPARYVCRNPVHNFSSVDYFLVPRIPRDPFLDQVVVYNGRKEDDWYRYSSIFGEQWLEYPILRRPQVAPADSLYGFKPTGTDCDCCTSLGIVRIGRFGNWDRKVLLHDVIEQVKNAL